jgi:hypothetical protein
MMPPTAQTPSDEHDLDQDPIWIIVASTFARLVSIVSRLCVPRTCHTSRHPTDNHSH